MGQAVKLAFILGTLLGLAVGLGWLEYWGWYGAGRYLDERR
jgi:hypothetical protein